MYNNIVEVEPYFLYFYADRGIAVIIGSRTEKITPGRESYLFIYFYF